MKIAVSGKGGVGKTTLSAMLAGTLALRGRRVIAIDADPDANLASALGVAPGEQPTPVAEMRELIAQRTGATDGYGGYFKLNPKVDDIPETYARQIGSIRLLVLGGISRGGGGCLCPASALVKALVTHLVLGKGDAIGMDGRRWHRRRRRTGTKQSSRSPPGHRGRHTLGVAAGRLK